MSTQPSPPRSAPIGAAALFLLACPLYFLMLAAILHIHEGDAATRGLGLVALFFGVLLWIGLGILLVVGARNGGVPRWAASLAGVLHPLSGIMAGVAIVLCDRYPGDGRSWCRRCCRHWLPFTRYGRLPALDAVLGMRDAKSRVKRRS